MKYPIRHIATIVKGQWQQFRTDDAIGHLLLDSRRLIFPATSLFIALRGPRRDGRRFMEELYRRGVRDFYNHRRIRDHRSTRIHPPRRYAGG